KVYQSMAAGCAVITSDTPPQRRALGNGVVYVAPNNPQALADAIASLISSPNILARKQSDAAKNAQRFTSDIITRELSQWIKEH
ncbi:glycosyltransferase, partial [Bifidobacterium pseudocatenulatum]